jgi:hypothetical protein
VLSYFDSVQSICTPSNTVHLALTQNGLTVCFQSSEKSTKIVNIPYHKIRKVELHGESSIEFSNIEVAVRKKAAQKLTDNEFKLKGNILEFEMVTYQA